MVLGAGVLVVVLSAHFPYFGGGGFFVGNSSGCFPPRLLCALVLTSVILINVLTADIFFINRDVRVGVKKLYLQIL